MVNVQLHSWPCFPFDGTQKGNKQVFSTSSSVNTVIPFCSRRYKQGETKPSKIAQGKAAGQYDLKGKWRELKIRSICGGLNFLVSIEAITNTRYGEDKARMRGVRLNFTTQLSNVNMEIMGFGSIAGSPYLGKQHLTGHDFAAVLDKSLEQIIFSRGQLDLFSVDLHQSLRKIHSQWSCRKDRLRPRPNLSGMTQCHADACQYL